MIISREASRHWRRQRGLGLATALFIVTVMALLAAVIFQLIRNNAQTTGEQILLTRAFFAAETGIQFGVNQLFPPNGGVGSCPATDTHALDADGLKECSAVVTCSSVTDPSGNVYYTVRSSGTCAGISRTIQVRVH